MCRGVWGHKMKRSFAHDEAAVEDPLKSIEQTIFNLGDPHPTLSVAEDVAQTARMVVEDIRRYGPTLLEAIIAW